MRTPDRLPRSPRPPGDGRRRHRRPPGLRRQAQPQHLPPDRPRPRRSLHLALRWEDIYRAIGGRQLRYGSNTAVLIVVVLAILVGVNYLAARHPLKKDLTKNQRYSLSDQTKKIVQGLKDDVRIVYFQRASEMEGSAGVDRIKDYQALSPAREGRVRGPRGQARPGPASST